MDQHRNKNRSRKFAMLLHLSEDEKYILDEKTRLSGMKNRAAFLRHMIVYGFVYDADYSELREYNTQLSRIGNNLNQLTKRINSIGNVYEEDVKEIKKLMDKVWCTQKTMLSKQPYLKQKALL